MGLSTEDESGKILLLSSKFLRFMVTSRGIHLDPDKVKAIQNMHPPKNLKELRGLQGVGPEAFHFSFDDD